MLTWLKTQREVRIALAVCAGLLGYKLLVTLAWASWYFSWFGNRSQEELLVAGSFSIVILAGSIWLWRSRRSKTAA